MMNGTFFQLEENVGEYIHETVFVEISYSSHVPEAALTVLKNKQIWRDQKVALEFKGVSILTVDKDICRNLYGKDLNSKQHCGQFNSRDLNQLFTYLYK